MADPLSLLREYVSGGKMEEVALAGDRVYFGGKFSFPKAALTGYKSKQVRWMRAGGVRQALPPSQTPSPPPPPPFTACRLPGATRRARETSTPWRRCSTLRATWM